MLSTPFYTLFLVPFINGFLSVFWLLSSIFNSFLWLIVRFHYQIVVIYQNAIFWFKYSGLWFYLVIK